MGWFKRNNPDIAHLADQVQYIQSPVSLPVGVTEFDEWSDRIIAAAGLSSTKESQKYTLATMLTQLPPEIAEQYDDFFVKALRRAAANQVAIYYKEKIYPEVKARLKAEEEEKQKAAEATAPPSGNGESVVTAAPPSS